jgi:hypothetical protein
LPFLQSSAKSWRNALPIHLPEIAVEGARAIMASRQEPDGLDFFPTPPWATRSLMERVLPHLGAVPCGTIWEPAAGEGHMSGVLAEYGGVYASDIHPHGLSCISWHCRIAAIGQNKAPKHADHRPKATALPPRQIPF